MYRFVSSEKRSVLNDKYKKIYKHARLQEKWDEEVKNCPELARTLSAKLNPVDLLTLPYEDLVDVYIDFIKVYNSLSKTKQKQLKEAANRVFSYSSYLSAIADFLTNENNGFKIYNCVYCDLEDARTFDDKRQFDTEHILDKGECPLVGLSLYNFCPACDTCNTRCKGTNPIGSTSDLMKKLSPTSVQYDFEHKVKFVLNTIEPSAIGRIKMGHPDWYEVDFEYKDNDYREVVTLFRLKTRYNLEQHKLDAMDWRFKAEKYRGISLALSALFHGNTIKQEKEELFRYTAKSQAHSNKLKLLADMMNVKPKR